MVTRRTALRLVVPLISVLSLAACKSGTTPPTTDPPTPTPPTPHEISGTVEGWPGGEAVVRAEGFNLDDSRQAVVAEGTISADGRFSLTLPVEEAELAEVLVTADQELFCPAPGVSTVEITPGPTELAAVPNYFGVYASTDSDERLGNIAANFTQNNGYTNFFASADATVQGECVTTYGEESSTLELDLDFKAGWNAVFSTSGESVFSSKTGPFPEVTGWTYSEEISPVPPVPCEPGDPECGPSEPSTEPVL